MIFLASKILKSYSSTDLFYQRRVYLVLFIINTNEQVRDILAALQREQNSKPKQQRFTDRRHIHGKIEFMVYFRVGNWGCAFLCERALARPQWRTGIPISDTFSINLSSQEGCFFGEILEACPVDKGGSHGWKIGWEMSQDSETGVNKHLQRYCTAVKHAWWIDRAQIKVCVP